jgi:carbon-monoxide dehydrogenase medium subunit
MVAKTSHGVRVAITGAGSRVQRNAAMESALEDDFHPDALRGIEVSADRLNADIHGSAAYRAHLVKIIAGRAVARAASQ